MGVQSNINEPLAVVQEQRGLFKHNSNKLNSHVATKRRTEDKGQHYWAG